MNWETRCVWHKHLAYMRWSENDANTSLAIQTSQDCYTQYKHFWFSLIWFGRRLATMWPVLGCVGWRSHSLLFFSLSVVWCKHRSAHAGGGKGERGRGLDRVRCLHQGCRRTSGLHREHPPLPLHHRQHRLQQLVAQLLDQAGQRGKTRPSLTSPSLLRKEKLCSLKTNHSLHWRSDSKESFVSSLLAHDLSSMY